jgi:hypothetical protein
MATIKSPINIVAAFGLTLGAVFGMAGTFVVQPNLQGLLRSALSMTASHALLAVTYDPRQHARQRRANACRVVSRSRLQS